MSDRYKQKALGRGLTALFGETDEESLENNNDLKRIPITKIEPNTNQPRKIFEESAMNELVQSIKTHGIITPIAVRATKSGYFQIIAGERRWRAARTAGLTEVPVIVLDTDDLHSMELALIENLQRQDLNPIEESEGFKRLIDEFSLTQEQVASRVGKSRSAVTNSLRILNLSDDVLDMIKNKSLSSGHARVLLSINDEELQLDLAKRSINENISVRKLESIAKKYNQKKKADKKIVGPQVDYIEELEKKMEVILNRKVRITSGKSKGTIELEYYGLDDLERLSDGIITLDV